MTNDMPSIIAVIVLIGLFLVMTYLDKPLR